MNSFVEKYSAKRSNQYGEFADKHLRIITSTSKNQEDNSYERDVSVSPSALLRDEVSLDTTGAGAGGSAMILFTKSKASVHLASTRRYTQADRDVAKKVSQDDALIRSLLKMHAEAVGLPVREDALDSDNSDEEDQDGHGDHDMYLSDDSSTNDDMYQTSLLQHSPIKQQASSREHGEKKEVTSTFRLMNDDDFDDDEEYESESEYETDTGESGSEGEEESDKEEEEEEEESPGRRAHHAQKHPPEEPKQEEYEYEKGEGEAINRGVSMDMKDLLQFSCSLVEDMDALSFVHVPEWDVSSRHHRKHGRTHTDEGSVVLSDDEDNSENYNKRVEKNERLAQQSTLSARIGLV
jgi:hypothetical protein